MAGGSNGHNGAPSMMPTSGKTWRRARQEGFLVQLPSGNLARVRHVSPDAMLTMGEIPDLLSPLIEKMLFEGADSEEVTDALAKALEPAEAFSAAGMLKLIKFIDAFCRMALVNPRIVEEPSADDEISIADLELQDRFAVYQYCTQPVEVLYRFHLVANASMESVSDGDKGIDPALEVDRNPASVGSVLP